jgi:glycosyltransferase involved in cell wall biosynthesis
MIDVVIPTYNPKKYFIRVLKRLKSPVVNKVIIIDDYSTETKNIEKAKKLGFVEIYRNEKNLKQGISRNRGFKKTINEYVLFMDDDVLVTKKMLREIDYLLSLYDAVLGTRGHHLLEIDGGNFFVIGHFFAFRREKFQELGGFISFYRREDLDLCMRAIRRKYRMIRYSKIIHLGDERKRRGFYDWITNIMFNLKYFDIKVMRMWLIHKPITLLEMITGMMCPHCRRQKMKEMNLKCIKCH